MYEDKARNDSSGYENKKILDIFIWKYKIHIYKDEKHDISKMKINNNDHYREMFDGRQIINPLK